MLVGFARERVRVESLPEESQILSCRDGAEIQCDELRSTLLDFSTQLVGRRLSVTAASRLLATQFESSFLAAQRDILRWCEFGEDDRIQHYFFRPPNDSYTGERPPCAPKPGRRSESYG